MIFTFKVKITLFVGELKVKFSMSVARERERHFVSFDFWGIPSKPYFIKIDMALSMEKFKVGPM